MKVLIQKFLSRVMHESYSKKDSGFVIKKIFDKHNIPCDESDQVYLYDMNNEPFNAGSPLMLFEVLRDWDKYLLNPSHNTVYNNWTWYYKVKHHGRGLRSYVDKFGKTRYIFETIIKKECLKGVTVIDHINIYLKRKDNSIKRYVVYMTTDRFVNPSTDATKYIFNIKELC